MSSEYIESVEDAIDKLKRHLTKYRAAGNLQAEARICGMIGRKHAELAGRVPNAKDGRRARAYFKAQYEIGESISDGDAMLEAQAAIGEVYEKQDKLWKALDYFEAIAGCSTKACLGVARVKYKLALKSCFTVKEHLLLEAIRALRDDISVEATVLLARIHHEIGCKTFNFDRSREYLKRSKEAITDWRSRCLVCSAQTLLAEQACLAAAKRPYEERRQICTQAWNLALPNYDQQLLAAKEVFDAIQEAIRTQTEPTIPAARIAHFPLACEQIADAYANLARAQSEIGDLDLAHITLSLLRGNAHATTFSCRLCNNERCRSRVADGCRGQACHHSCKAKSRSPHKPIFGFCRSRRID